MGNLTPVDSIVLLYSASKLSALRASYVRTCFRIIPTSWDAIQLLFHLLYRKKISTRHASGTSSHSRIFSPLHNYVIALRPPLKLNTWGGSLQRYHPRRCQWLSKERTPVAGLRHAEQKDPTRCVLPRYNEESYLLILNDEISRLPPLFL